MPAITVEDTLVLPCIPRLDLTASKPNGGAARSPRATRSRPSTSYAASNWSSVKSWVTNFGRSRQMYVRRLTTSKIAHTSR
jgi:hypothetical protein